MGRTELQDAVPMTVGQEFHAFGAALDGEIQLLKDAEKYLYAAKHGRHGDRHRHQCAQGLREAVAEELAELTGKPIVAAPATCSPRPGSSRDSWCIPRR